MVHFHFFLIFFKVSTISKYFFYREKNTDIWLPVVLLSYHYLDYSATRILIKAVTTQVTPS